MRRRSAGKAELAVFLLLLILSALSDSSAAAAADNTQAVNASSDAAASGGRWTSFAEKVLQRLQLNLQPSRPPSTLVPTAAAQGAAAADSNDSSSSSTWGEELPDFSSTANTLTQLAVKEARARAAAITSQSAGALDPSPTNSNNGTTAASSVSSSSSSNPAQASISTASLQLQELQRQAANVSVSASDSSSSNSSNSSAGISGLQLLLQTIKKQWAVARNRQQQQQQQQQPPAGGATSTPKANVGDQWMSGLASLASTYPNLAAFARLARSNSALLVSFVVVIAVGVTTCRLLGENMSSGRGNAAAPCGSSRTQDHCSQQVCLTRPALVK